MAIGAAELRKSTLFATMTERELASILPACSEQKVKRGRPLFSQGVPGQDFYIVTEGQVVLEKLLRSRSTNTSRQTVVRPFGPGEVVGWSCITADAYTASAVVGRDSTVIRVDSKKLRESLEAHPKMGYKFMYALAKRVAVQMEYLEDTLMTERALVIEEVHKRTAAIQSELKRIGGLVSTGPEQDD